MMRDINVMMNLFENTKEITVAAYCRVSTDKEDQINSLASQIKYFTEYISSHANWALGEVYYDEGITGTSVKRRAGFNRMIQDALSGKINLIITKEVSRFARNTVDTLLYTRKLKERGVGVFFMNDNIYTLDSDGELRLTIMASMAQEESRKTSERVKWGQKRRMEQGVVFGRDLLGYYVREGKLIINPEEAPIVKLIFHKFLTEGKGAHTIARELRESGIKPKRCKDWSNTVILRVLRNEKYAGDLCQKKTITPDYLNHNKKYNRGHEEKVYIRDHHEPIIERGIWEQTQTELARRSPGLGQKSKYSNRYWCSGKLYCGECGQRFVSRTKKLKRSGNYKAWRCYAAANHGGKKTDGSGGVTGCNSAAVNEKVLTACVSQAIALIQINKDKITREIIEEIKALQASAKTADTSSLLSKISELNDKKRKAIDLTLDGTISREDLKRQTIFYDNEIESLSKQISDAENSNSIIKKQSDDLERYVSEISRIMDFGPENTALYRELLNKIVLYNGKKAAVYLNFIHYEILCGYKTSGRLNSFNVEIVSIELNELPQDMVN